MLIRCLLAMLVMLSVSAQRPITTNGNVSRVSFMNNRHAIPGRAMAAGVQAGSANLLRYSEALDNAAWVKENAALTVVAAGTSTPEGSPYFTVTESDAAALHHVTQTNTGVAGKTYYLAIIVKKDANASVFPALVLQFVGGVTTTYRVLINSVTGAILAGATPGIATSTTDFGDRFQVVISGVAPTGTTEARAYFAPARRSTWGSPDEAADATATRAVDATRFMLNEGSTALPYVATTDLQSIASLPPGTATLVRGATTAASTDDPVVSNSGWTFDSGDRVSGLPAKGANWTTTNCSGVECYTITSAGTEYVNGVARRNLLRWSEDFSNAVWEVYLATKAMDAVGPSGVANSAATLTAGNAVSGVWHTVTVVAGTTYTASWWAKRGTLSEVKYSIYNVSGGADITAETSYYAETSSAWTRISKSFTAPAGCTSVRVYTLRAPGTTGTMLIAQFQLNLGSTALEYQKTTDSREWLLGTPGNYVGLLTGWYRWDRVLGPGEVLNSHRGYIKPTLNAKGNTIQ